MQEEKTCKNCKHFINYYIIRKIQLKATKSGCCEFSGVRVRKNQVTVLNCDYSCEKWEQADALKEEDIATELKRLSDSAEKLALVLQIKL